MILLTSDWHLDDNPANTYRWKVFEEVHKILDIYPQIDHLFILGDLADRKDRHSGALVNKLVFELRKIIKQDVQITILKGNHDAPLHGVPFWAFLSVIPSIHFVTSPTVVLDDVLVLPHSVNPREEWKGMEFTPYRCVMMHQTIRGVVEDGHRYDGDANMMVLPRTLRVYSGDIHTPQQVGNTTYVGAPHPVKFGDSYSTRMLILNDDYSIYQERALITARKAVLNISSLQELHDAPLTSGDQAMIRFTISPSKMEQWPIEQEAINAWAKTKGIEVASVEAIVELKGDAATLAPSLGTSPTKVLRAFAAREGLDEELLQVGLDLLREGG